VTAILDEAFYSSIGAAIFPVQPGSKLPFPGFEWKSAASTDLLQWRKWAAEFPGCNWALYARGSGLVIVDVDVKNVGEGQAWQAWQDIRRQCNIADGEPNVKTPTGGWHIYLRVEDGTQISQAPLVRGVIDIRHEGYTIVPPSVVDGKPYLRYPSTTIHAATAALLERVSRSSDPAAVPAPSVFALEDIRNRLGFLLKTGYFDDEPTWTASVWAIKRAFGDAGYPLAQLISYRDEQNRLPSVWAREGDKGSRPTTCATLIKDSNEAGFREHQRDSMFGNVPITLAVAPPDKLIQSSAEFIANFVAPSYLLDGILQKHFCYALTAATGAGKTAIALRLAVHVALGRKLGERDVERGRVLFVAAENYVDVQARFIASAQHCGFDLGSIDVYFIAGKTKLSEIADQVTAEARALGDLALVIVDTSAATFEGADENSNVDALTHAKRIRSLTELQGNPTVLLLCHPVKSATNDNLVPRGGGALLAEIDGNLCARKGDSSIEVHWSGKFRGMDFTPMAFRLDTVVADRLKDARGRNMPTVLATPIDDAARQVLAATERSDQDRVLRAISDAPGKSYADIAKQLGWTMSGGQPYAVKVRRAAERLAGDALLIKERGNWVLTSRGERELNKLDQRKFEVGRQNNVVSPMPPLPVRNA
jgi:hypothetical protein